MSNIFINVGQCGNQIGNLFWDHNIKELEGNKDLKSIQSPMFSSTAIEVNSNARCVLVDSEPKVIEKTLSNFGKYFDEKNVVLDQNGRANNWGFGFFSRQLHEETMNSFRIQIEKADYFNTATMFHSSSGGTGSGLGSRILNSIRDCYPKSYIISVLVTGSKEDTPLQYYNTLLSVQYLQEMADAVLHFKNNELLDIVNHYKRPKNTFTIIGIQEEMNKIVAQSSAGIFSPYYDQHTKPKRIRGKDLLLLPKKPRAFNAGSFLHYTSPIPEIKFIDVGTANTSRSKDNQSNRIYNGNQHNKNITVSSSPPSIPWKQLVSILKSQFASYDDARQPIQSLQSLLVFRGLTAHDTATSSSRDHIVTPNSGNICPITSGIQWWNDSDCTTDTNNIKSIHNSTKSELRDKVLQFISPVHWNPQPIGVSYSSKALPRSGIHQSLTCCAVRSNTKEYMKNLFQKTKLLYDARAYWHWYTSYGCDDTMIAESFNCVEDIIDSYERIFQ